MNDTTEERRSPTTAYLFGALERTPKSIGVFMVAALIGRTEVVLAALRQGVEVNARRENGTTALHCATSSTSNLECVQLLLSEGADINARDNAGITPLMRAVENYNVEVVLLLLSAGAKVNQRAADNPEVHELDWRAGRTALGIARNHKFPPRKGQIRRYKKIVALLEQANTEE